MRPLFLASFAMNMITRHLGRAIAACATAAVVVGASACDKVPLMAPTGSVINLFAASSTIPLNSEIEIIATVIENGTTTTPPSTTTGGGGTTGTPSATGSTSTPGAGTPVQNGTLVTFTTTIG